LWLNKRQRGVKATDNHREVVRLGSHGKLETDQTGGATLVRAVGATLCKKSTAVAPYTWRRRHG
jgi:hypothetical protein